MSELVTFDLRRDVQLTDFDRQELGRVRGQLERAGAVKVTLQVTKRAASYACAWQLQLDGQALTESGVTVRELMQMLTAVPDDAGDRMIEAVIVAYYRGIEDGFEHARDLEHAWSA